MSGNSQFALRRDTRIQRFVGVASFVAILAAALPAHAGSRKAVRKARAATVAVEWRTNEKAGQQPGSPASTTGHLREEQREEQRVEIDAQTGQQSVRTTIVGAQYQPIPKADLSLSSGVLLSDDGLVATFGREDGGGRYTVLLDDGRSFEARMVVTDRRTALCLLKIDAGDLPYLSLAESEAEAGDQVFAAFCTGRRERAAAQGMVSADHRPNWASSLLLDLKLGPMSTGGPLVDDDGRLVGILSGKGARSPNEPAADYAAPLDAVRALLKARQGENSVVIQRGLLGISLDNKQDGGQEQVVVHVLRDSPAQAAGVQDGDTLVAIDGHKVASPEDVVAFVGRHALGDKVSVTVVREGAEKALEVTIGPRPGAQTEGTSSTGAAVPPPAAAAHVVRPEQLYVLTEDGQRILLAATPQQLEPLRNYARTLRLRTTADGKNEVVAEPVPNVIRVERSDLEKKLEEFGDNVESLQQQVEKLTEEIKSLRAKLDEQK